MEQASAREGCDPVSIVEGSPCHGAALQFHRVKLRHRRDNPGAPHLGHQFPEGGPGFRLGELHGHSPTGEPPGVARLLLQGQVIELDHHPIGVIGQLTAAGVPIAIEALHLGQAAVELAVGIGFEADSGQPLQGCPLLPGLGLL